MNDGVGLSGYAALTRPTWLEPYPLAENVEVISPLMLASIPAVCQGPRTGVAYAQADQTDAKLVEPSRR